MNTLDDIRRAYPDAANASDLEILTELSRRSGKPITDVATDWGVDVGQNNGDFMRGLRRGGQQMLGSAAGAVGLAADLAGADGLKQGALDYAREKFERDQLLSRPTDDVTNISSFGDAVDFAQAGLGQLVPMALGSGGAGVAGRVLGGAVARRGAAVLAGDAAKAAIARGASRGMTAAVGAQSIAQESGSIYADMVADGNDDSLRALGFGTVAGALDALPEVRALSRLTGGGERAAGGLLRRMATEGGKQAGMEALTEVGQTGLELQANYKDLTDAEALRSYANAAALGALGGGAIGAVTGIPGQRRVEPVLDQRHDLFANTYGDAPRLNELPTGFGTIPPAESSRGLPTLNEYPAGTVPAAEPELDTSVLGKMGYPSLYEGASDFSPPLQREGLQRYFPKGFAESWQEARSALPDLYGPPSERALRSPLIPPAEVLVVGPQGAVGVNVGVGTGDQSVFDSQPVGDTLPGALELAKRRALSGEITGGPNVAQPNGTGGGAGGAVAGGSGGAGGVGPVVAAPDNAGARAPAAGGTAVEPVADGAADGQPSLTVEVLREQYGVPKTKKTNKLREAELGRITALVNAGAIPADAVTERMTWLKAGRMEDVRQANDVDERNFVTGLEPEAQVAYMLGQLPTETQDILRQAAMGVSDQDIAKAFGQNDKQWTQKKREAAIVAIAEVAKRLGLNGDAVRAALSAKPKSTAPSDTTRAANLADLQEQYARGDLTDEQRVEIESQIRQMTQDRAGMTAQDAANLGIAQDVTEDGASTGFQVINAGADLGSLERAAQDPADLVEFDAGVNRDLTEREVDADSGAMRAAQATYEAWRGISDPEWDDWGPQQKKRWMRLDQADQDGSISEDAFNRAGVEMLDEAEQGNFYARQPYFGMELSSRDADGNVWSYRYMNFARYPRVLDAMRRLLVSPAGHAYDQVSGVYLSENTGADAFVVPEGDGMYRLVLTQDFLARATDADLDRTINHEAAHIADDAAGSAYYSGDAEWDAIVADVRRRFDAGSPLMVGQLRSFLRYPFTDASVSPEAVNSEVFAQLWAAHLDPRLRASVQQQLPEAFNYVETMYADYSRTGSRAEAGAGAPRQGAGTEGSGGQPSATRPTADAGGDGPRREGRAEGVRFSRNERAGGTTRAAIEAAVRKVTGGAQTMKVMVVENTTDLPDEVRQSATDAGAQAFVLGRRAYFVASRIQPGTEMAVFLHEVGVHLGMEGLIGQKNLDALGAQIQAWAESGADTKEARIARAAMDRVMSAEGQVDLEELVAYFVEEAVTAGVNPTADLAGPLGAWFRTFWAAVKSAMRKLGMMRVGELTPTDIVNLAYGAARLEIAGTWHGTAAQFRRFDHKYMGTGEGTGNRGDDTSDTGAFGWGSYLAQDAGIARGYWMADVRRKSKGGYFTFSDGTPVTDPQFQFLLQDAKKAGVDVTTEWLQRVESNYKELLEKYRAAGPRMEYDARKLEYTLTEIGDALLAGGVKFIQPYNPEGSLMRADINIADDELLDWDKPLSEQSAAVKEALEGAELGADTFAPGQRGEQLYRYLTREKGSGKAASEYLDSIGVKGIKFLDQPSRNATKDWVNFPRWAELRTTLKADDYLGFDGVNGVVSAAVEDGMPAMRNAYDMSQATDALLTDLLAWLVAPIEQTRNIVVFNDKNILRVNSWVANDKARIRFSKPAQATAVEATLKEVLAPAARRTVAGYARKVNDALLFGHQLVDRIGAALPSARAFFRTLQDRITLRDRREARVLDVAEQFYKLDKAEQARANRFIYESTTSQKWGYKPEWDASAAVDADMAAKFDALSPQAQAVVKQVFAYGNETQREYEEVLLRTKGAEIKAQLAEAEAAGDAERIAALRKEEDLLKRENGALKTLLSGPYAPLKRFGRHAVVVKSQAFMDAEAAGEGARIEEMQANPDHYQVMFVDSVFEREKKVIELQREFPDRSVVGFEREPESTRATELPLQAIKRLQQAIVNGPNGEKLSERSQRILARIASDLYVASLDSLSARHSQQRRRNIHGADEDMMRAFVSQGRGMAHMLATLEVNGPMQESLQKMRSEARTGRTAEKADALNEVLNRYTLLMETRPTPIQDGAMATTSLWMLLTNPAYWFGNATQPFMMSLPVLAGRHNAGASWSAVMQGYRDTMPALEGRALDPKKLKSVVGREADAVQELLDRGHIDLTLEREMGEISESSWHTGHKIMGMLRLIPQRVEVTNRVATALAAYRLEYVRATGQGMDAATAHSLATEYADQIILDTHGDYSSAGAPRVLMQGNTQLPIKLMGQFRKFQLVQLGLMAKLIRQSFSKDMSSDEKTAARWSLAWMLGTYLTMTGLTGVIGSNVVWGIVSAFGDDDEKDLDLVLTRALGDRDAAILLTRGVPALLGMDVSQRLGMGNVLSLFPYADTEPAVKDSYTNYLMAATGPFLGGLLPRAASGVDYINQGDYWKGLELLVPNGITNGLRAARYATEGYTNRKGDLLMTPEEIGVVSEIFQAVGLPTTTLTDRTWKADVLYELEQKMRADATRIKRQYTEAARSRDTETMAELRGEWKQLQEMRARNGMKPQPLSTLLKSPQQQREREEMADEGVALTKATAGFTASVPD